MTLRSPFLRCVAVAMLVTSTAFAAGPVKRRAVPPGSNQPPAAPATQAILTGTVTDSWTGAAVAVVQVLSPDGGTHTDSNGRFTLKINTGRDVPLTFSRGGYETLATNVNISGDATRSFQLTPKATVKVRTITGTTFDLDTESVEFGYIAPFSGYTKGTKLNLCKPGGMSFTPDRTEILRITGPAQLDDAACCNRGSMPAINVELKAGGTSTASFVDACIGYRVDIIAIDHKTGTPLYIHFSDIAEVTFP